MKRIVHTVSIILAVLLAAAGGYYGGRDVYKRQVCAHVHADERGI